MDYDAVKVTSPLPPRHPPHSNPFQALHASLPPFAPLLPVAFLPFLAFFLLAATFTLAFYFSTYVSPLTPSLISLTLSHFSLPKASIPLRESLVATTASILGGFGVVALFCSVGVYV
ncbi:hypothetical protein BDQ17DRAFT_134 [Cyathus striatus]|nr:hypothetical protein BDQ17DRAFT_134 [Cyathus striatus]